MPECNHVYLKNCNDLHLLWMYNMMQTFYLCYSIWKSWKQMQILEYDWFGSKMCYPKNCLVTCKKILAYLFLEIRAFWAITQKAEWAIKNSYIFCSRLVLKNSKDKNISQNLENPILGSFFSKY